MYNLIHLTGSELSLKGEWICVSRIVWRSGFTLSSYRFRWKIGGIRPQFDLARHRELVEGPAGLKLTCVSSLRNGGLLGIADVDSPFRRLPLSLVLRGGGDPTAEPNGKRGNSCPEKIELEGAEPPEYETCHQGSDRSGERADGSKRAQNTALSGFMGEERNHRT